MRELFIFLWIFTSFLFGNAQNTCECLDRIIMLHNLGDFRLISSPNYPKPYCHGMDCHWHVVAPNNKSRIQFSADNLDLRENMDQLILYDFDKPQVLENRSESYKCSGDDLCYYTSRHQYLTIRFKTSTQHDIDNFGFQAVVTVRNGYGGSNTSLTSISSNFAVILSIFLLFSLY